MVLHIRSQWLCKMDERNFKMENSEEAHITTLNQNSMNWTLLLWIKLKFPFRLFLYIHMYVLLYLFLTVIFKIQIAEPFSSSKMKHTYVILSWKEQTGQWLLPLNSNDTHRHFFFKNYFKEWLKLGVIIAKHYLKLGWAFQQFWF